MKLRKGTNIFCGGFGVGKVTDYFAEKKNNTADGYVVIDFPHLEMNVKLLLSSPATMSRLRPVHTTGEIINALTILNSEPQAMPANWVNRKVILDERLKSTDLISTAMLIRDLNALPQFNLIPNHTDLVALTRARDIFASELIISLGMHWEKALTLVENTPDLLRVEIPRRRGRKPKGWKPEMDERFGSRQGLLALNV